MKREKFWNSFTQTGDIEAYLAYKNDACMNWPRAGFGGKAISIETGLQTSPKTP